MFRIINKLKNRKGFTLVELIVVLAVLGIIAAIAVPRFIGVQEQAKRDADYATGAMIAKAAELYLAQHEDEEDGTIDESKLQLSDVEFKSDDIEGKDLSDVTVTSSSDGAIKVVVTNGSNDYEIYPGTTSLD